MSEQQIQTIRDLTAHLLEHPQATGEYAIARTPIGQPQKTGARLIVWFHGLPPDADAMALRFAQEVAKATGLIAHPPLWHTPVSSPHSAATFIVWWWGDRLGEGLSPLVTCHESFISVPGTR